MKFSSYWAHFNLKCKVRVNITTLYHFFAKTAIISVQTIALQFNILCKQKHYTFGNND